MPTIAITGASGHLGRLVTAELLQRGLAPSDLVLVTRSPDALSVAGADVRRGDFSAPDTLTAAFAGVDRLLLISTDNLDTRTEQQRGAVAAAEAAGVQRIAYTSAANPIAENPVAVAPSHRATEEAIAASSVSGTFLRNALYAEFQIPDFQQAIIGQRLVSNQGDGATSYISRADCAAAAAGALLADTQGDVIYEVTGTALMTAADKAALAGELGGNPVEVVHVDDETFIAGLVAAGIPAEGAAVIASFGRAVREGYLDQLTDAVTELAGRPPRSLHDVVAEAL